ncbi:MAG TPA: discoidin domain-containing protein, partial [Thermoguttaceae bacterium]|nr:discoidin domain-containing protein [Thermoguttaceae bacterium]
MHGGRFVVVLLTVGSLLICGTAFGGPKPVAVRVMADSQASGDPAVRALDGNPDTMWHTSFGTDEPRPPHELTIDLGASYEIGGFSYLPRHGGSNGTIKDYEFYISDDYKKFGDPVSKGTFSGNPAEEKHVQFAEIAKGRFVRLRALSEVNGAAWTSIAELKLLCDGVVFTSKGGGPWNPDLPAGEPFEQVRRSGTMMVDVGANSQSLGTEAFRAMDGDPSTIWRTRWDR